MVTTAARRRRRRSLRNLAALSAIVMSSIALAMPPTDSPGVCATLLMEAKHERGINGDRRTSEQVRPATNEAVVTPTEPRLPPRTAA